MITRRSLLTGLVATALIAPVTKLVRATEITHEGEYLWTSSWYEQIERGLWRHQCYRFKAATAPEMLVVNASPDEREIAGVQLDWNWCETSLADESCFMKIPVRKNAIGWVRGNVDIANKRGIEIELTRDEERELLDRNMQATKIIRPNPSDLFGFFRGEGRFA